MRKAVIVLALVAPLEGCVGKVGMSTAINLRAPFDAQAASGQLEPGSATINGSAFINWLDDRVVTCAGKEVHLTPATEYAIERFSHMYGTTPTYTSTSMRSVYKVMYRRQVFFPDPFTYKLNARSTTCNARGEFVFHDVKDGDYFVTAGIYWKVDPITADINWPMDTDQGGSLAKRVSVANGQADHLVLSK